MFAHELAAELGMTVGDLLERIDSREFTRWIAFDKISPIGGKRMDVLAAMVAMTVTNAARTKGRAARIADFLIRWTRPKPSAKVMRKTFEMFIEAANRARKQHGKDNDRSPERQAQSHNRRV